MAEKNPADTLLEVDGIETCYGLSQVLFGLSLKVHAGEIVAQLLQVCYREDVRTPRAHMELASFDNIVVMG